MAAEAMGTGANWFVGGGAGGGNGSGAGGGVGKSGWA